MTEWATWLAEHPELAPARPRWARARAALRICLVWLLVMALAAALIWVALLAVSVGPW